MISFIFYNVAIAFDLLRVSGRIDDFCQSCFYEMEEIMQNSIKSKITIFFCVVCIFLIGTAVPALAAGTLTIAVSSGTVRTGDTGTVTG